MRGKVNSTFGKSWRASLAAAVGLGAIVAASAVTAKTFTAWGAPVSAESLPGSSTQVNTASNDGCPIQSPYDGSLYMASNRPGGQGGLDIWIAPASGDGWGTPVNAGPTVNTAADEFCPTPARGNRFFFVRRLSATDSDIYVVKKLPKGWGTPSRLPTGANAINSPWEEWSPSWFETRPEVTERAAVAEPCAALAKFSDRAPLESPSVARPRPDGADVPVSRRNSASVSADGSAA